jgi:uncharacterized membrane protein HdeD (DUF308 family)
MLTLSARNWWLLVLRGVLAVLFAVLAYFWPLTTVIALVILFGAYALVDGIFALAAALERIGRHERWGAMLVQGILGIGAGLVTFFWPGLTALTLLIIIGVWAIVTGVAEIVAAIQLREVIENEWLLALGGVLSVLFGVLVLIFPGAGALSVVWLIATYAFIYGVVLIILGFRLRSWQQHMQQRSTTSVAHQM